MLSFAIFAAVLAEETIIEAPSPIADVKPITPTKVKADSIQDTTISKEQQKADTTTDSTAEVTKESPRPKKKR